MYIKNGNKRYRGLYRALMTLKTEEEFIQFFEDLCTTKEISAMEQRSQVAELLVQGKIYNEILDMTGASSATISRVNRSLHGPGGGYDKAFDRLGLVRVDKQQQGKSGKRYYESVETSDQPASEGQV